MAAVSKVLIPMGTLQFREVADLERALAEPGIEQRIIEAEKTFYLIDVRDSMRNLTTVGSLLQLAYGGTKGFQSNVQVVQILGGYQRLIKQTFLASSTFVQTSIQALQAHQLAWKIVTKEPAATGRAIQILSRCAEMAGKMAETSEELVRSTEKLSDTALATLEAASKDELGARANQERVAQEIAKFRAQQASLQTKSRALSEQVEEAKVQQREAQERADVARAQGLVVALVSAALSPPFSFKIEAGSASAGKEGSFLESLKEARAQEQTIRLGIQEARLKLGKKEAELAAGEKQGKEAVELDSLRVEIRELRTLIVEEQQRLSSQNQALQQLQASLEKQAAQSQDLEGQIRLQRAELQKEEREANADLAATVVRLTSLGEERGELDKAVTSLELAVKTLGKVRTVFENARLYWEGVKQHCLYLSKKGGFQDLADFGLTQEFLEEVEASALSWLALGKMNYLAHRSMVGVDKKFDTIMSDLPTKKEAERLIATLGQELLAQIAEDNERLALT